MLEPYQVSDAVSGSMKIVGIEIVNSVQYLIVMESGLTASPSSLQIIGGYSEQCACPEKKAESDWRACNYYSACFNQIHCWPKFTLGVKKGM